MHRTLTSDFHLTPGNPPYVDGNDSLYRLVADVIAGQPETEHLPELIKLFIALEKSGVALEQHLECAIQGLIEEFR